MNRRSFLKGALAAPAIVSFSSLMPLWIPKQEIIVDNGILVYVNGVLQQQAGYSIAKNGIVTFDKPFKDAHYHVTVMNLKTNEQRFWSVLEPRS